MPVSFPPTSCGIPLKWPSEASRDPDFPPQGQPQSPNWDPQGLSEHPALLLHLSLLCRSSHRNVGDSWFPGGSPAPALPLGAADMGRWQGVGRTTVSCHRKQEFVGGAGLTLSFKTSLISAHSVGLSGALPTQGSLQKLLVSPPTTRPPPPPHTATRDHTELLWPLKERIGFWP